MAKNDDTMTMEGRVVDVLPSAMFRIELANGHKILGYPCGKMRKNNIRILMGDRVEVEISVYDMDRCRITYRYKN